jgi:hypothetical protein
MLNASIIVNGSSIWTWMINIFLESGLQGGLLISFWPWSDTNIKFGGFSIFQKI